MKKLLICAFLFLFPFYIFAQELNCQITVSHQKIQGTNKEVFRSMQRDIYEFMNNHKWTEHVFGTEERIECTMMINLVEQIGTDKFIGTLQVQSRRPVFNTSYNTVMLNYKEKSKDFQFEYIENEPLEFNESSINSNLISVLAFYAYVIIGLDYDSFAEEGGTNYFQKALTIANNCQSGDRFGMSHGWQAYETTNSRYALIENLTNSVYSGFHSALYQYHRLGLDVMSETTEIGRSEVAESLKDIVNKVHRKKPDSFIVQLFITAKDDEIIKMFSDESVAPMQKTNVYNLLKELDPANTAKYEKIIK